MSFANSTITHLERLQGARLVCVGLLFQSPRRTHDPVAEGAREDPLLVFPGILLKTVTASSRISRFSAVVSPNPIALLMNRPASRQEAPMTPFGSIAFQPRSPSDRMFQ